MKNSSTKFVLKLNSGSSYSSVTSFYLYVFNSDQVCEWVPYLVQFISRQGNDLVEITRQYYSIIIINIRLTNIYEFHLPKFEALCLTRWPFTCTFIKVPVEPDGMRCCHYCYPTTGEDWSLGNIDLWQTYSASEGDWTS